MEHVCDQRGYTQYAYLWLSLSSPPTYINNTCDAQWVQGRFWLIHDAWKLNKTQSECKMSMLCLWVSPVVISLKCHTFLLSLFPRQNKSNNILRNTNNSSVLFSTLISWYLRTTYTENDDNKEKGKIRQHTVSFLLVILYSSVNQS